MDGRVRFSWLKPGLPLDSHSDLRISHDLAAGVRGRLSSEGGARTGAGGSRGGCRNVASMAGESVLAHFLCPV